MLRPGRQLGRLERRLVAQRGDPRRRAGRGDDPVGVRAVADQPAGARLRDGHRAGAAQARAVRRERFTQRRRHLRGIKLGDKRSREVEAGPWSDRVLQDLDDQVDIRQDGVGVLAAQLDVAEVRTPLEQHVPGRTVDDAPVRQRHRGVGQCAVRSDRGQAAFLQEREQIGEIGRGAVHGAALSAFAQVKRPEQPFPVGDLVGGGLRGRQDMERDAVECRAELREELYRPSGHLRGALENQLGVAVAQRLTVLGRERRASHARDRHRRVDAVCRDGGHGIGPRSQPEDPLETLEPRRDLAGVVHALRGRGVLLDEPVDGRAAEVERRPVCQTLAKKRRTPAGCASPSRCRRWATAAVGNASSTTPVTARAYVAAFDASSSPGTSGGTASAS